MAERVGLFAAAPRILRFAPDRRVRVVQNRSAILSNPGEFFHTSCTAKLKGPEKQALLIWWRGWDSNPRSDRSDAGFQDRCIQPLCHLSDVIKINYLVYPSEQIARERMAQVAESYLTQLCPA